MNIWCGTDIIEIERIKESVDEIGDKFIHKVFTDKEITYCESKKGQKYQHYAARFAAKEAIFKAVSEALEDKYSISWKNIEITKDGKLKPHVNFIGTDFPKKITVDISISHCKQYAVAMAVAMVS